ncbi:YkoF family thiamine/hydroxymethylpyrimidine-binding protein [Pseudoteredinibacter isoporae]|uniref:YkoF family thiamine/hydroxymethylpyrimidine-binding protein n=1 Tax=Pseudoteredinibacter isoporae TaxID=570281 RepID=UPI00310AF63D
MKLTVDISLYPLKDHYIPPIKEVIAGFESHDGVTVETGHTATLLTGDFDEVMAAVQAEMKRSFEAYGQLVFVAKFIGRDVNDPWDKSPFGG